MDESDDRLLYRLDTLRRVLWRHELMHPLSEDRINSEYKNKEAQLLNELRLLKQKLEEKGYDY